MIEFDPRACPRSWRHGPMRHVTHDGQHLFVCDTCGVSQPELPLPSPQRVEVRAAPPRPCATCMDD